MLEKDFARVGGDGDALIFDKEMLLRILNVDMTETSINGSKTRAGGRPDILFYNPNPPLANRSATKSPLACTGFFGSNAAGECMPLHWQLSTAVTAAE